MQPGQVIGSRYVVERRAGSGGMGAVYCALDRQTGARVAIKVLHGHGADHAARFAREARLLSELRHPGIVRYVDHGVTDAGDGFIAMEWLEGEDLSARLKRGGALAVTEALALATQVAGALRVAHTRRIVHRDLKPANLFLEGGAIGRVKILDFGIARVLEATTRITVSGEMIGTPGYMSPEQARGERAIDARSDVFALGCILFRCITGRRPFQASDPLSVLLKTLASPVPRLREIRDDVPPALDDLVDRMLAKLAAERPRDAGAVLEELQVLTGEAPAPRRPPGLSRSQVPLLAPDACFVLARFPGGRPPEGLSHEAMLGQLRAAEAAAAAHRAQLEVLADGSLLVTAPAEGRMADQAAAAARCALALRPVLPGMALAIIAGAAPGGAPQPPLEEGVRILERTPGAAIGVDAASARLLEGRFEIAMVTGGFALAGERRSRVEATAPSGEPTWRLPEARSVDDAAPTWTRQEAAAPAKKGVDKTWDDPQAAPRLPPAAPAGPPAWVPPVAYTGSMSPAPVDAPRPSSSINMLLALGVGAVLLLALLGLLIIAVFAQPSGGSLPQRGGSVSGPARP